MKKFSEGEISEIRRDYRQAKYPEKQIEILSQLYACDEEDIREIVKDIEVKGKRDYRLWSKEDDARLMELRDEGKGINEIAKALNRTEVSVQKRLQKFIKEKPPRKGGNTNKPTEIIREKEPEVKVDIEVLTEKVTSGKCSAVIDYADRHIFGSGYGEKFPDVAFEDAEETAEFWRLIAERVGKNEQKETS